MSETNNKFTRNLAQSRTEIVGKRAQLIAEDAKAAQEDLVRILKTEYRDIERKLMNLDDIYPEESTSLSATKKGFDAKKWATEMQATKIELALKKVEVDTAEETYEEYFEDIKDGVQVKE